MLVRDHHFELCSVAFGRLRKQHQAGMSRSRTDKMVDRLPRSGTQGLGVVLQVTSYLPLVCKHEGREASLKSVNQVLDVPGKLMSMSLLFALQHSLSIPHVLSIILLFSMRRLNICSSLVDTKNVNITYNQTPSLQR